ncbi:MAG: molybdopterin-dependent oxidoreductase [bacterium]
MLHTVSSRIVLLVLLAAGVARAQSSTGQIAGSLRIRAEGREIVLSPADLAKLPRHELRVVAEGSSDSVTVSGVALWDVLQQVPAPAAEASGRQRAVMYVRAAGADGQNAVFALVEVDPGFSRRAALLADRRNGKALDAVEGPWRLIVPDDMRHARWIRGLVSIEVGTLKP